MSLARRVLWSVCLVVLAIPFAACQPKRKPVPTAAQQKAETAPPSELQQIQALEDRRALSNGLIVQWSRSHPDPLIRARALLALARVQKPSTAQAIAEALSDPAPLPRYEAAFAAGEMGTWVPVPEATRKMLVQSLLAAEANEAELPVKLTQLEALGKLGTPAAVERLADRLLGTEPQVAARAALSLGVAAKAGAQLPGRVITGTAPMLKPEASPGERFGAAYALAMSRLPAARPALLLCARDPEAEVRLLCARGLGDIGSDTDAVTLRRLLDDPDYRVVVEATRALAKLAGRCRSGACPALGALSDLSFRIDRLERGDVAGGAQPLLALAQQGLPMSGRPLLASLRGRVIAGAGKVQGRLKADFANIDCRLAATMDKQQGKLEDVLLCGGGLIPEARRLILGLNELATAPAKDPERRVLDVAPYLRHGDNGVKAAALNVLGELKAKSAADRIRPLIDSSDLILATAAASAAGKIGDTQAIPQIRALVMKTAKLPELAGPIAEALANLNAKDAEVELRAMLQSPYTNQRLAAAQALTKLTGTKVEVPEVEAGEGPFKVPYVPKNAKLVIKTEKGEIEVKLYEDAPMTAGNIYRLAQRGFFRNLTFHRVVPDFVVQGGDPRGDGEGGPGYTIRDEINHHPYAAGVVGMALSGPDTGGSQFFITTSPQPHLDGRYTAFGEVVAGREIVHQLLEGDKILDVRAQ
ncbi:MAG: peptidylprolyl isomerase [Myxococcaceae bacterium]|nr:peptidylprolyl isomerase [Myxococcaceae bacterium]